MLRKDPFDSLAESYDSWYDSGRGSRIFEIELRALRKIRLPHPSLEIGVGTGRFAEELGIEFGVDISEGMLRIARKRGIEVILADAHNLPFRNKSFRTSYFITSLCFLNAETALREASRVSDNVVIGFIPEESPLGKIYAEKGKKGHPIYSHARFLRSDEVVEILSRTGFRILGAFSTLFSGSDFEEIREGIHPSAGFIVIFSSLQQPSPRDL
ncbi:MAG: hypothetical protein PWR09_796 [Archaeoglobi archaeon]|nr:hypothetical protein [Archaeoglobi archaeon]